MDSRAEEAEVESDTVEPLEGVARGGIDAGQPPSMPPFARAYDSIERPGDTLAALIYHFRQFIRPSSFHEYSAASAASSAAPSFGRDTRDSFARSGRLSVSDRVAVRADRAPFADAAHQFSRGTHAQSASRFARRFSRGACE
ncbi:hypothetical protein BURKHO8Y_240202 [Burkholderia sp. 8Y]|nr:hypothetical protein BURKHO8Y_240202 [Burkholderia sp. 8Y]